MLQNLTIRRWLFTFIRMASQMSPRKRMCSRFHLLTLEAESVPLLRRHTGTRESRATRRSPRVFLSAPPTSKSTADGAPLRWAASVHARRPRETATPKKALYPLRLLSSGVGIAIFFQERTTSRLNNPKCTPRGTTFTFNKDTTLLYTKVFNFWTSSVHDPSTSHQTNSIPFIHS